MTHSATPRRLTVAGILLLPLLAIVLLIPTGFRAEGTQEATLYLRPHCAEGTTSCPTYAVKDPETLQTSPQKKGNELHMDLVLSNPGKKKISRVRAWLQYNSAVIEGIAISAGSVLPTPAPGELEFSATDGLIKIDLSAKANEEPAGEEMVVARLLLGVKTIPQTKTDVLSFYDVQPTGHTRVVAIKAEGSTEDILTQNPGSLLITFEAPAPASSSSSVTTGSGANAQTATGSGTSSSATLAGSGADTGSPGTHAAGTGSSSLTAAASSASSAPAPSAICGNGLQEEEEQCDDGNFLAGDGCSITCILEEPLKPSATGSAVSSASSASSVTLLPDGMTCAEHLSCKSGLCSGGVCRGEILKVEDSGACTASAQCLSGSCESNRCSPQAASSAASIMPPVSGTAFALLQVRNVRITTEGTSLYVAWDPLASSQLKAYNLYYGTTTGRYIQRKTVSGDSTSMAIRGLPEQTTYYVAIRALSTQDEESAFSQEAAVEVGNPKSSTAPLTGDLLATRKPVTVPGETGLPSMVILILAVSAITGTVLASRRQIVALTTTPRAR